MMEGYTKEEVKVLEEAAKKNAKKLKDAFPEGFFSKKRPQEKPKEYIVPLTYDDIYYGIWKDPKELIRCKDCMAFDEKKVLCKKNNMIAVREDDWCSRAVRKEG